MKNTKVELKDTELKKVNSGTAPELPATQLAEDAYNGMFSNPTNPTTPGQYEPHFYNGKVVAPGFFINNKKVNDNEL